MTKNTVLSLDHVSLKNPKKSRTVLNECSIDFSRGVVYVILTSPSPGKQALISLIAGLEPVQHGKITYHDQDLSTLDLDEYRAKQIGTVFQESNLIDYITPLENLDFSFHLAGVEGDDLKERELAILESVGIDKKSAMRRVETLSPEAQKQVAVARALASNSDLIIADEPVRGLDDTKYGCVLDVLVKEAHNHQRCVIILTRSMRIAAYADELWGLNQGNLVFIKERKRTLYSHDK